MGGGTAWKESVKIGKWKMTLNSQHKGKKKGLKENFGCPEKWWNLAENEVGQP